MNTTAALRILAQSKGQIYAQICVSFRRAGIVPTVETEEDLYQETCERALGALTHKRASWQDSGFAWAPAYVRVIARNAVADHIRAAVAVAVEPLTAAGPLTADGTPWTAIMGTARADAAVKAYMALSPQERAAVDATFTGDDAGEGAQRVARCRATAKMRAAISAAGF